MLDTVAFAYLIKFCTKLGTIIREYGSGHSISTNHLCLKEIGRCCCIMALNWQCFDPLGKVINCDENVLAASFRDFQWSCRVDRHPVHEVYNWDAV